MGNNLSSIVPEVLENLASIEKDISKIPLPNGSIRTTEQILYLAPLVLQIAYKETSERQLNSEICEISKVLSDIQDKMEGA